MPPFYVPLALRVCPGFVVKRGWGCGARGRRLSPLAPHSSFRKLNHRSHPHLHLLSCKLFWRQVVQRTMGTLAVVIESPSFDLTSRITQTREPVGIQALVPQSAVEALSA